MQNILVIGSPGSGKSTLARAMAAKTGLPLVHLDQIYWQSGWTEPSNEEGAARLARAMAGERWIIDGNYSGTLEPRLAVADMVVLLDLPGWLCVWRILKRIRTWNGRVRPDMPEGCPERFNWEFFWYTLWFRHTVRPRTEVKLKGYRGRLVRLRTPGEVALFLERLDQHGHE